MASVYARARDLCRQLGETPQLLPVLFGLWLLSVNGAQHQTAREQAQQLLSIAQTRPDAAVLLMAHWALGATLFFLGEFVPARTHLDRASSLYDPTRHRSLAALYGGYDARDFALAYTAWAQWLLGYPDQAVARAEQARALAEELSHPVSLCSALHFSSALHTLHREGEVALKFADESARLATDHGFQQVLALTICDRGGALIERGQAEDGVAQLREGLAALYATGSGLAQTLMLGWQAAGYCRLGRVEEGLAAVAEALAAAERTGECFFEAELHRLRGDLLLKRDAQAAGSKVEGEAEVCFRRALEIASRQQAKSLELRAATSLSRLLARQHRRDEARTMLDEIYGWFTEGFDTADLKDAKALLDELSGSP